MASVTYNYKEWFVQLVNMRTKQPIVDDTGNFQVYTAGVPTRLSIFDANGAAITQQAANATGSFTGGTLSGGAIRFYTAKSVANVDLSVLTAGGRAYFLPNMSNSVHRIDVDPDRTDYTLVVAINERGSSTTVRGMGFRLKKGMEVKDVYVNVTTAWDLGNTRDVSIGVSGSSVAYIQKLKCSTTGLKRPVALSTTGIVLAAANQNWGKKLMFTRAGTTAKDPGYVIPLQHVVATAVASNNLVFKRGSVATATFTTLAGKGYVYLRYNLAQGPVATI